MEANSIDVPFSASRTGDGEGSLTWGQSAILEAMAASAATFNLPYVVRLDTLAAPVTATAEALGRLLSRHESLRTHIDTADGGSARQVVRNSGSLRVPVFQCPLGDVDAICRKVSEEQCRDRFQEGDLLVRVSLVVSAGLVRAVVFTYCHVAVDGAAMRLLHADLGSLLATGEFSCERAMQPLEVARFEKDDGVAVNERAMRYWAEQLRRIPIRTLDQVGPAHEPRGQAAKLASFALQTAIRRLAARHRTMPSAVVLAATALLLARRTGRAPIAVNLLFGNRSRPEYRNVVANLTQVGLFVLDIAPGSAVEDIISPTGRAAFQAYRHAYYDHSSLAQVRRSIAVERGAEPNPFCCFNLDTEPAGDPGPADLLSTEDMLESMSGTTLDWSPDPPQFRCQFCLKVDGGADGRCSVVLTADTTCLPPADIESFLYGLERTLVEAAARP